MLEKGTKMKTIRRIGIIILSLLLMAASLASCGGGSEEPVEEKLKVEEGWTIEDDGAYTFAFVFENISDEVLESAKVYPIGYDADGNVLDMGDNKGSFMGIGPLRPGEKTVIGEELWAIRDIGSFFWSETPASFGYEIKDAKWSSDSKQPHIVMENVEVVAENGDAIMYNLTLRNAGSEDFDWQKALNDTTGMTKNIIPAVVMRDDEGKVKGMATMSPNTMTFDYPLIPAGESIDLEVVATAEANDNNEYMIMWN